MFYITRIYYAFLALANTDTYGDMPFTEYVQAKVPETNYGKQISNLIRQAYGKHLKVFEQTIPRSVRAAETSAAGKSIFAYDPKGKVAEAYKSLAKEVQADADRQRKLSSERAR